jgi:hypothetical protein
VTAFKEVSKKKFDEIREVIRRFIESHDLKRTFRLRNLDDDKDLKRIIKLFEENSVIKGSVNNATIYVIPVYHYDPSSGYGNALIAFLIIEKDQFEYTVKIGLETSGLLKASNREEAKKLVDEKFGGFVRLLGGALATKHPLAIKLTELADCLKGIILINFLYGLYGDEILNDDTIPGLHSLCSHKTSFFANDKAIVIPGPHLWAVRDIHSGRIFVLDPLTFWFYEAFPEEKIFYDALFMKLRDLLKPEAVVEDEQGYRYAFSSSSAVVDGRKISLVAIQINYPQEENWYVTDILTITCDEPRRVKCLLYSFDLKRGFKNIDKIEELIHEDIREAFLKYILGSGEIQEKAKKEVAKELAKEREWEVLPA